MGNGGGLSSLVLSSESGAEADSTTCCGFLAASPDKLLRTETAFVNQFRLQMELEKLLPFAMHHKNKFNVLRNVSLFMSLIYLQVSGFLWGHQLWIMAAEMIASCDLVIG